MNAEFLFILLALVVSFYATRNDSEGSVIVYTLYENIVLYFYIVLAF